MKLNMLKQYLAKLQELKKAAFSSITSESVTKVVKTGEVKPKVESAFAFIDSSSEPELGEGQLERVRTAFIFDQLTNDFKIRKEAIMMKL